MQFIKLRLQICYMHLLQIFVSLAPDTLSVVRTEWNLLCETSKILTVKRGTQYAFKGEYHWPKKWSS